MSAKRTLKAIEEEEIQPSKRQRLSVDNQDPMIRKYDFATDSDSESDGAQAMCMFALQ